MAEYERVEHDVLVIGAGGAGRMLRVLADHYPEASGRAELALAHDSGSWIAEIRCIAAPSRSRGE